MIPPSRPPLTRLSLTRHYSERDLLLKTNLLDLPENSNPSISTDSHSAPKKLKRSFSAYNLFPELQEPSAKKCYADWELAERPAKKLKIAPINIYLERLNRHIAQKYDEWHLKSLASLEELFHPEALPYHFATIKSDTDLISLLVETGVSIDRLDVKGSNALFTACKMQNLPCIKALIDHGISLNIFNLKGQTPLLAALKTKNRGLITLLLQRGASPQECLPFHFLMHTLSRSLEKSLVPTVNADGMRIPFDPHSASFIAKTKELQIFKDLFILIRTYYPHVNDLDDFGNTPLLHFCQQNRTKSENLKIDLNLNTYRSEELIKFFVDSGCSLTKKNEAGISPIELMATDHIISDQRLLALLKTLPQKELKRIAKAILLSTENFKVITFFVLKGFTLDVVDHLGRTPLFHAVDQLKEGLVAFLIEHGANPNLSSARDGGAISPKQHIVNKMAMLNQAISTLGDNYPQMTATLKSCHKILALLEPEDSDDSQQSQSTIEMTDSFEEA